MVSRNDVIADAVDKCMKDLYSLAQPSITWEDFVKENKEYLAKKEKWEAIENPTLSEFEYCGPKPFEFYYLPKKVLKEVCDDYINAYKLNDQQELLDIIETIKGYCLDPISETWDEEFGRSFKHDDNLDKEIKTIISKRIEPAFEGVAPEIRDKFFEFLDRIGKFFSWHQDLNSFSSSIYLGASPNSNKEAVIENWKKYRNKEIEIDETKYNEEYD